MAVKFGMSPNMEARFGRAATDAEQGGFSYQRFAPNFRQPFGHRHRDQEEFYIVLSGGGQVTLEERDAADPPVGCDPRRTADRARIRVRRATAWSCSSSAPARPARPRCSRASGTSSSLGALLHLELAVACSLLGRMLLEPVPHDLLLRRAHLVEPLDRAVSAARRARAPARLPPRARSRASRRRTRRASPSPRTRSARSSAPRARRAGSTPSADGSRSPSAASRRRAR